MRTGKSAVFVLIALAPAAWAQPAPGPHDAALKRDEHGRVLWTAVIDGKEVPAPAIDMGDDETTLAILEEGKHHNQVMKHLRYLTHEIGTRLTGSSNAKKANEWCRDQYAAWGLSDPHLEEWGAIGVGFDRGPSQGKLLLRHEEEAEGQARRRRARGQDNADKSADTDKADEPKPEPKYVFDKIRDFELTTLSWTAGTDGPVRGKLIKEPKTDEEFDKVKESLKGAWILLDAATPQGQRGFRSAIQFRYDLRARAREKAAAGTDPREMTIPERLALEPVAGYISASRNDLVITTGAPKWRELDADKIPQDVHVLVTRPDYDAMNSRLADAEDIYAEFDLKHTFNKGPVPVYNTIAEIRGTEKPDEVVIISAHLDSWDGPGSQGATDNGTGTVVTLEAARILAAVHAKPKRTIRFIDWTGEEQGLLGSHAYVDLHKDELDKISACFVDDGGTNSEGGVTCADQMVEYLAAATAPTNNQFYDQTDGRYLNVDIKHGGERIRTHGSSDHASFNRVHVPGFFWDETGRADYNHGHHTQFDTIDYAIENYLVQSSTNAAITAYRLACAPGLLPREVIPEPKDEKKDADKPAGDVQPAKSN